MGESDEYVATIVPKIQPQLQSRFPHLLAVHGWADVDDRGSRFLWVYAVVKDDSPALVDAGAWESLKNAIETDFDGAGANAPVVVNLRTETEELNSRAVWDA